MSIVVIYHRADHDGRSSAAILKYRYPGCKLIPMDYGDDMPWKEVHQGDTVFIVDFCLEPFDRMVYMNTKCRMIWIDHHISSINEAKRVNLNPEGIREVGRSGCELTWAYVYPDKEIPTAIHLLGRYDVWDHEDPNVLPFQYGMLNRETSAMNMELWKRLIENDGTLLNEIIAEGKIIFPYQLKMWREYAKNYSFEAILNNLRAVVVNLGHCGSMAFEGVYNPEFHDIMIAFAHVCKKISVSAYTDKEDVDVSKLALKYGGGGHKKAAGWEVRDSPTFMRHLGLYDPSKNKVVEHA